MSDQAPPRAPDEDAILAGELALGFLSPPRAAAARGRADVDPAFERLVAEWETWLAGLGLGLEELTPSPALKTRIDEVLFARERPAGAPPPRSPSRSPTRHLRAWQAAAAALAALAVLEFGLLLLTRTDPAPERVVRETVPVPVPEASPLVAALVPSDAQAPVVVSLDVPAGVLRVDPSSIEADGRAVQLWLLPSDGGDPVSLGVLTPNADNTLRLELLGPLASGDLPSLAISLEPEGGSPTGLPTGPIVATGAVRAL